MELLTIRRYEARDLEAVRDLHVRALQAIGAFYKSGPWDSDLDNIESIYLAEGDFLVGELGNLIVAMGALKKISEEIGEIKRVRVSPDHQRQGLGQMMLDSLEQRARELKFSHLQLDTTIKQEAAQQLYLKNGWVEVRRETKGWPLETIFYAKQLE